MAQFVLIRPIVTRLFEPAIRRLLEPAIRRLLEPAMRAIELSTISFVILSCAPFMAAAEPLAPPGDLQLRHDLQLLNDSGLTNIPLTAWPIALGDIDNAISDLRADNLNGGIAQSLTRVRQRVAQELETDIVNFRFDLSGASNPRIIRTFENTPREDAEARIGVNWLGERFTINLSATYANNPFDRDEFRPDGTYVGVALGNWMVTAGWQDRWWGPGRDANLILSNNARPTPGISIQRNNSTAFETKWLSWMGPWTVASFMSQLDDNRVVNDAWLFGLRGSIRPFRGLEIGITRTAQWCGDGRPCDLPTFGDLLIGNDNRGVNVTPADEPGNQLGGIDVRWVLPRSMPVAAYMQWIGEDGRGGGGAVGSWMRQLGLEYWGRIGSVSHRTHIEVSDSTCQEGGFGFSGDKPNCAYEHGIYRSGYRYRNRSLAHSADGDSRSYSIGSTLVQSAGHTWNATLRYMEINRAGPLNPLHTLTPSPQELIDVQITHQRESRYGRFYAGLGYSQLDDLTSGRTDSDVTGFVQWSSR